MRSIIFMLVAASSLGGCAFGSLDCTAGPGQCKASFQRFLTDTTVSLTTPAGGTFNYSSNPNAAGTEAAFSTIGKALDKIPTPLSAPEIE